MSNRRVTKEEFDAFIASYPEPLNKNVTQICEPPVLTFNNFSDGKEWPASIVASVTLYETYPKEGAEPYKWAPNAYYIRVPTG